MREDTPRLAIPNQTVQRLMYGYLRDPYRDVGVFSVDRYACSRLLHEMAYRGAWRPVLEFLGTYTRIAERVHSFLLPTGIDATPAKFHVG